METKEKRTKVVASLMALAGLLLFSLFATGGDLEPNAPPGPTMKTLDEIYDAVTSGTFEKTGYCESFISNISYGDIDILTVPPGKRFILRKLNVRHLEDGEYNNNWSLSVGGSWSIPPGYLAQESTSTGAQFMHDFPDGCLVVNGGETLTARKHGSCYMRIVVIGYFYDVQ